MRDKGRFCKNHRGTAEQRFARNYKIDSSGCWLWQASVSANGYGAFNVDGRSISAHRFSWLLYHGEIPKGHVVCHCCDVPACVNPKHLFVGSQAANRHDAVVKMRHAFGQASPSAKITPDLVRLIRKIDSAGVPQHVIADCVGINQSSVSAIVVRRAWKQVP